MTKRILASLAGAALLLAASPGARADNTCPGGTIGAPNTLTPVQGNVTVNGSCTLTNVILQGNVQLQGGTLVVQESYIGGNVQAANCTGAEIISSFVGGSVQIQNCHNTSGNPLGMSAIAVGGGIQCQNNTGSEVCQFSDLVNFGNMQIQNNSTTTGIGPVLTYTYTTGNLQCQNNGPAATSGGGNYVLGSDQCIGSSPGPF
jgi:hypothetical protein